MAATLDFTSFFTMAFSGAAPFFTAWLFLIRYVYLIQNSQAVKKVCGPQKGYGEKRCEIQGGGQEMAVMVG